MARQPQKILLVDADPQIKQVVTKTISRDPRLKSLQVEVIEASSNDSTHDLLQKPPALCVVNLSSQDLPALMDVVSTRPRGKPLPILLVSSENLDEATRSKLKAGYRVTYEPKPLDPNRFARLAGEILKPLKRDRSKITSEMPAVDQGRLRRQSAEIPIFNGNAPAPARQKARGTSTIGPGSRVGSYLIEEQISGPLDRREGCRAGAMGVVYRARHTEIDKAVALKVLCQEVSQVPDLRERFRREPQAANRVSHPNVVEIYDSGATDDGSFYFAMELLSGKDLAAEIAEQGPLPIERVILIGIQLCDAIEAAHHAGLIHRDLKPRHIFLATRGGISDLVKVLDFGVVKIMRPKPSEKRLTKPGIALGTPTYMAPEQNSDSYDHRVDIYSIGVILYEMLTGRPPHPCEKLSEAIVLKTEPVKPLRALRPETPDALQEVVLRALSFKADYRPRSMEEMGRLLRTLLNPIAVPPVLVMLDMMSG